MSSATSDFEADAPVFTAPRISRRRPRRAIGLQETPHSQPPSFDVSILGSEVPLVPFTG